MWCALGHRVPCMSAGEVARWLRSLMASRQRDVSDSYMCLSHLTGAHSVMPLHTGTFLMLSDLRGWATTRNCHDNTLLDLAACPAAPRKGPRSQFAVSPTKGPPQRATLYCCCHVILSVAIPVSACVYPPHSSIRVAYGQRALSCAQYWTGTVNWTGTVTCACLVAACPRDLPARCHTRGSLPAGPHT